MHAWICAEEQHIQKNGIESICMAAVHGLHSPEFAKGLKFRAGCLALLASFHDDEWLQISSKLTSKLILIIIIFECVFFNQLLYYRFEANI